jgi:hypothetical protein
MLHLASLANQITFKKSFSDKLVLETFVEDVTGEKFVAGLIETEKEFTPAIGGVNVRFDIFAQSEDGRVVLELQRVRYDTHFDRFMHYFLAAILEQVRSHKDYAVARKVVTIVLLTAPYRMKDLSGRMVEDSMLISQLDPRSYESDKVVSLFGHKLIFLNPHYEQSVAPAAVKEWLKLIKLSMDSNALSSDDGFADVDLGSSRPAILRAAMLSSWDGLSADERTAFLHANQEEQAMATVQEALVEERKLKEAAQQSAEEERGLKEEERRLKEEERRLKEEERRLKEEAQEEIKNLRELLAKRDGPGT